MTESTYAGGRRPSWGETLDQRETWIDGQGRLLRISEMDPRHCLNVYRYLTQLHQAQGILHAVGCNAYAATGPDADSPARIGFDRAQEALAVATRDPVAWIKEQPLLLQLADKGGLEGYPPEREGTLLTLTIQVRVGQDEEWGEVAEELRTLLDGPFRDAAIVSISPEPVNRSENETLGCDPTWRTR